MKLPEEKKQFADRLVEWLGRWHIATSREGLARAARWAVGLAVIAIAVAAATIPGLLGSKYPINDALVGTFATTNYKADRDYEIYDSVATDRLRSEAVTEVPPVYDLNLRVGDEVGQSIRRAFDHLNQIASKVETPAAGSRPEEDEAGGADAVRFTERLRREKPTFERLLGWPVSAALFDTLAVASLDKDLGPTTAAALEELLAAGVVGDRSVLVAEGVPLVAIRPLPEGQQPERVVDVSALVDVTEAKSQLARKLAAELNDRPAAAREAALQIAFGGLRPNLIQNRAATLEREETARDTVAPVTLRVRRGEMIVRDGDPILPRHLLIFKGIHQAQQSHRMLVFGVGMALLVALLVIVVFLFARRGLRAFQIDERALLALAVVLLVTVVLVNAWDGGASVVQSRFPHLPLDAVRELLPVAFGPMLIGFLMAPEVTLIFCVLVALLSGLVMDSSLAFSLYTFIAGVTAAAGVARTRQRTTLVKSGLLTGVVSAAAGTFLMLASGVDVTWAGTVAHLAFGLISGVTAAVLVTGLLPVVESAFGFVSDIKLLELANLNHPLLKELIVQAPGTYHHSIIIGSMVEGGADAIGANALLARVMAYYHDIGKIKNPRYFAENQRDGNNPHDKLTPSMSALILRAHVKDGLELARQHRLPSLVSNAIAEHHGTNLMSFFYEKAKEAEDAEVCTVNEQDYRYTGQRPRSRETALVMIADAIEAASRSVEEPSSDRLMGLVQKTVNRLFADGALNESELTLRDLNEIAKAYHRVLLGIYHDRPAYHAPATKERRDTKETTERRKLEHEIRDTGRFERRPGSEVGSGHGEAASQGEPAGSKEAARADGDRAGNGQKASGGERGRREETAQENLKRLGSDP
ncbi:MAG: HDIG domain-containing protein [Deltaproteobacteria bacterium]|nr:HDIG domain-containing protein [Deltaproteobacteria bacterium]